MLLPRVMPCLLLSDGALVKTIKFSNRLYIGDPINTINIFNRLEVDELILLDIDATPKNEAPAFELIAEVASECTAPLTYGGGIRSVEDVHRIMSAGVEKIVINTGAARDINVVTNIAKQFGSQAVVVSIDVRRNLFGGYRAYCESGLQAVPDNPIDLAKKLESAGAGEILLNSIDREGTMKGFDLDLVRLVSSAVNIPLIACGGAGARTDLVGPIKSGASAVACGSLFVFQGPERGVLVNFPTRLQIEKLFT